MPICVNLADEIAIAYKRIAPFIHETYLQHSAFYSELTGANVYFKCENLQRTGSFKLRGATNKYLSLAPEQQKRGVVAASTGNHGKAVAYAAKQLKGTCTIFAPENADAIKLAAIKSLGAVVRQAGSDCIEAEAAARAFAEQENCVYISPYNDPLVIAGQGTTGLEICNQLEQVDAVIASVGGGGMIGGIASYVKSRFPNCQIVGCSPENSNVMIQSLAAGKLLDLPSEDTLSDGTAGGVEPGSVTFELCRQFITKTVSVTESEIANSLVEFINHEGMLIEGAAAVSIAALKREQKKLANKNVVVVLCGANIGTKRLSAVLSGRQI